MAVHMGRLRLLLILMLVAAVDLGSPVLPQAAEASEEFEEATHARAPGAAPRPRPRPPSPPPCARSRWRPPVPRAIAPRRAARPSGSCRRPCPSPRPSPTTTSPPHPRPLASLTPPPCARRTTHERCSDSYLARRSRRRARGLGSRDPPDPGHVVPALDPHPRRPRRPLSAVHLADPARGPTVPRSPGGLAGRRGEACPTRDRRAHAGACPASPTSRGRWCPTATLAAPSPSTPARGRADVLLMAVTPSPGLWLGAVHDRVIRHARCPVLLTPAPAAGREA